MKVRPVKEGKEKKSSIEVEGIVSAVLPELEYKVLIDFRGIKHEVKCHVSGKMRTNFIELEKGDEVRVRISLYDIDKGIIIRRLTMRNKARNNITEGNFIGNQAPELEKVA